MRSVPRDVPYSIHSNKVSLIVFLFLLSLIGSGLVSLLFAHSGGFFFQLLREALLLVWLST